MIYADNAATTKLDINAFEAMKPFLLDSYGNPSQPYSFSRIARKEIKEARRVIAECIGAESEEIFFTSGGTESDNWAIKSGVGTNGGVITSEIEHHAILNSVEMLDRKKHTIILAPVDLFGRVDVEFINRNLTDNISIVSIMFANNEIGTIQPIKEIAEIVHNKGCLLHTDAVQAVGHIPIDVKELGIDMMSASAHKFNGPKGIGFIYIKKGTVLDPYINGGHQENGMRAGTENVASIIGMAVALRNNCEKIEQNAEKVYKLENVLLNELDRLKVDYIRNGYSEHIPGNINISIKGGEGEVILHRLDLGGICISTGSACDSVNTELSHVIKAIGVSEEYAYGTIRISLGKDNTEDDVLQIANAIAKVVSC